MKGNRTKGNTILADHGEWLEVDVSTPKHHGAVMKIEREYFDAIRSVTKYRIYAMDLGRKDVYAFVHINGKNKAVHRIICGESSQVVDHRDHDGLNNRLFNLRPCTNSENLRNRRICSNNKSGRTGVHFHRRSKKWRATIEFCGRKIWLGQSLSFAEAVELRKDGERLYFGEFAFNG